MERETGQHSMQFLTSPDLKNWTKTSTVNGEINDDRYLFECPDFYELPVEGTSEKKWVLTAANTQYAIGTFDGTTFQPEEERLQGQHGRDFYAPQTFSNEPNGRRIEIGWWRTNTAKDDMTFNQSQSEPLDHKLIKTPNGIRLSRLPIKELESLCINTYKPGNVSFKENVNNPLTGTNVELAEIRMNVERGRSKEFTIKVKGFPFSTIQSARV